MENQKAIVHTRKSSFGAMAGPERAFKREMMLMVRDQFPASREAFLPNPVL